MKSESAPPEPSLHVPDKVVLAARIWRCFLEVRRGLRRAPLPDLVAQLGAPPGQPARRHSPRRLSRAVDRSLNLGPYRTRCLVGALVLYRLLREQGDAAELVIGLPDVPTQQRAHAWVELDGRDVGPPPGRGRHAEFARFG